MCILQLLDTYLHTTKHRHEANYFESHLVTVDLRANGICALLCSELYRRYTSCINTDMAFHVTCSHSLMRSLQSLKG
jgi:hypothetical protein